MDPLDILSISVWVIFTFIPRSIHDAVPNISAT